MRILILAAAVLLSACSARQCVLDGDYLQAKEFGPLQNPSNGELPAIDPSYDIPPGNDQPIQAHRNWKNEQGEDYQDCLDKPPRMSLAKKS